MGSGAEKRIIFIERTAQEIEQGVGDNKKLNDDYYKTAEDRRRMGFKSPYPKVL